MNRTIEFFKEISKVPRPSGKEEKIKEYLINFAAKNNLECFYDDTHNVIIKKKTNIPNCNKTLILQAHSDMVCEKNEDTKINFETDPIPLTKNEKYIFAKGTTLGADNGIGLSIILSILSDNSLQIPNIEAVFTTQEETTMKGANALDFSLLKGQHLLSLDGTVEGNIEASCAGMVETNITKKYQTSNNKKQSLKLSIKGLRGGHSGLEINKGKLNAIKLMFEFLNNYKNEVDLTEITGGGKPNAIPRECFCTASFTTQKDIIEKDLKNFIKNYNKIEKEISCSVTENENLNNQFIGNKNSQNLIDFANNHKNGVLIYSDINPDFPITSNNFANIKLENGNLKIIISLRSSVKEYEQQKLTELFDLAKQYNLETQIVSVAPFFERKKNSYLQNLCKDSYEKLFNTPAKLEDVHAGLEGGVFIGKNPNLDICVIAANIDNAHSPEERVEKQSIERVYLWVEDIIRNF